MISAPSDSTLSPLQSHIIAACGKKVKEGTQRFATEHKELHSCVSKVGKAVDRVCRYQYKFCFIIEENICILGENIIRNVQQ